MDGVKDEAERTARKIARGRSETTPVHVHSVLFVAIGLFVALIVLIVLLLFYLV